MLTTKWLQNRNRTDAHDIQKILSGLTSRWRAGNSTSFGQGLPESFTGRIASSKSNGRERFGFVWPVGNDSLLNRANALGYHVFLEAAPGDLSLVADAAEKANAVGVIFDAGNLDSSASEDVLRSAQSAHSKLSFLLLSPGGKEPQ